MTLLRVWPFLRDNFLERASRNKTERSTPASLALGINGLALLVTAVTQSALGRLSLYHAIVILHMAFFFHLAILPYPFHASTPLRYRIGMNATCFAFAVFAIYVAANARTYGSQPECNQNITYIFFFKTVSATAWWIRVVGVVFGALVIFTVFFLLAVSWFARRRDKWLRTTAGEPDITPPRPRSLWIWAYILFNASSLLSFTIIGIITLEQTISVNNLPDENSWGFGQIIALILLIGPLSDLYDDIFSKSKSRHDTEAVDPSPPTVQKVASKVVSELL